MGGEGCYEEEYELPETPTYRVAAAFAGFIVISLLVELGIHAVQRWLQRRKLVSLVHVLEKIKDELMILGFISICLVLLGKHVASLCVPHSDHWLTCPRKPKALARQLMDHQEEGDAQEGFAHGTPAAGPLGTAAAGGGAGGRVMPIVYSYGGCPKGMESMMSEYGLKELDMFIFLLAMLHIALSVAACGLAFLKVRQFRDWEHDHRARLVGRDIGPGKSKKSFFASVRLTRAVSMRTAYFNSRIGFLERHGLLRETPTATLPASTPHSSRPPAAPVDAHADVEAEITAAASRSADHAGGRSGTRELTWLGLLLVAVTCFFNQFLGTVTQEEYLTVRRMFLESKGLPDTYDFYAYLRRITMHMFVRVVGTSWWLWLLAGLLLLLNFDCSHVISYLALVPIVLALVLGSKMQRSLALVGLDYLGIDQFRSKRLRRQASQALADEQDASQAGLAAAGARWTDPEYIKDLFWLGKPELILVVIHAIIFLCAYQLSYVVWSLGTFGLDTCIFTDTVWIVLRVVLSVVAPVLCSYNTLPLFALLSSMNPEHSRHILPPRLTKGLKSWLASAKRRSHGHHGHHDDDSDDDHH